MHVKALSSNSAVTLQKLYFPVQSLKKLEQPPFHQEQNYDDQDEETSYSGALLMYLCIFFAGT